MYIKKQLLTIISLGFFLLINLFIVDIVEAKESSNVISAKEKIDLIPFYWTAGIIGGVIGLTLSYVSWRKYTAEKREKKKDQTVD